MRLVDIDKLDCTGKTVLLKFLEAYEKKHPLNELELSTRDWDVAIRPGEDTFKVVRRK